MSTCIYTNSVFTFTHMALNMSLSYRKESKIDSQSCNNDGDQGTTTTTKNNNTAITM